MSNECLGPRRASVLARPWGAPEENVVLSVWRKVNISKPLIFWIDPGDGSEEIYDFVMPNGVKLVFWLGY